MANANILVETKRRLNAASPFFGWKSHVHRFNEHEIPAAQHISEQIGVPIVFKRLSTPDVTWKSTYHDSDDMFIGGNAWFQQAYNPSGNPGLRGVALHPAVPSPCRQLFETMVIEATGDVYPCTVVAGRRYKMGNLLQQSLDEV